MKFILLTQLAVSALGACFISLNGNAQQHAAAFLIGASIIFLNIVILGFCWSLILNKKYVALAVGIIVSKYALLALVINELIKIHYFDFKWILIGLGTLPMTGLSMLLVNLLKRRLCLLLGLL